MNRDDLFTVTQFCAALWCAIVYAITRNWPAVLAFAWVAVLLIARAVRRG